MYKHENFPPKLKPKIGKVPFPPGTKWKDFGCPILCLHFVLLSLKISISPPPPPSAQYFPKSENYDTEKSKTLLSKHLQIKYIYILINVKLLNSYGNNKKKTFKIKLNFLFFFYIACALLPSQQSIFYCNFAWWLMPL